MTVYKKLFEPAYGDVAPEVCIGTPQNLNLENPKQWREQTNLESIAGESAAYQSCSCYKKVMSVRTETRYMESADQELIRVKIFLPDDNEIHPVLIYYHGGAFSYNSIEVYEYVHRFFSAYGKLIVVAPDYRLAPEYKFPTGLLDAYNTLIWTKDNIAAFNGDPENISVAGDSSGGNFAAVVSMMSRDKKGPVIKKQILIYPLTTNVEDEETDSEKHYAKGYFLELNIAKEPIDWYFEEAEDKTHPYASPLLSDDLTNLPPACFISAECDPLLDQGLMYASCLKEAGIELEYHIMKGMIHGFLNATYGKSFDAMNHAIHFIYK